MKELIPWFKNKENSTNSKDWLTRVLDNPLSIEKPSWSWVNKFPQIDISENNNQVVVKAEIPGMSEKDIELSYHDGNLNIKGEKKEERQENKKGNYYRESYYGSFARSIPLGNHLEWDQVSAEYKNGALNITIPKKEESGKKITINVE